MSFHLPLQTIIVLKIIVLAYLSIILFQSCEIQSENVDNCINPSVLMNTNIGDSIVLDLTKSIKENYNSIERQTKTEICNTVGQYSAVVKVGNDTFQLNFFTDRICQEAEDKYPVGYLTAHFQTYDILLNDFNMILFDGKVLSLDTLEMSIYKSLLKADLNNGNQAIHFNFNYDSNTKLTARYSIFRSSINAYMRFIEHLAEKPICDLSEVEINTLRKNIYPIFWFKDSKPPPPNIKNIDSILKTDYIELELKPDF